MIYYHVFWTKPFMARQYDSDSMSLVDFEALTWITSALEVRRHSPLHLITDSLGADIFRNSGLAWLYDEISTALDQMPQSIHPSIFWDGGKMFAFLFVRTPCVIFDYDAILWRKVEETQIVTALHEELRQWKFYENNRDQFEAFGFPASEWNWEINPVNTAFVYFPENSLPRCAGERSVQFMQDYSLAHESARPDVEVTPATYNRATLFAGQRLLPMCAWRQGCTVRHLVTLDHAGLTLERNPHCSHLWISKALYRCCPEARTAYVNFLIRHLNEQHPQSSGILAEWGLDQPLTLDSEDSLDLDSLGATDSRRRLLRRFLHVDGEVQVEDANVKVFRPAIRGGLLLPGERVLAASNSGYELAPAEQSYPQLP